MFCFFGSCGFCAFGSFRWAVVFRCGGCASYLLRVRFDVWLRCVYCRLPFPYSSVLFSLIFYVTSLPCPCFFLYSAGFVLSFPFVALPPFPCLYSFHCVASCVLALRPFGVFLFGRHLFLVSFLDHAVGSFALSCLRPALCPPEPLFVVFFTRFRLASCLSRFVVLFLLLRGFVF